MEQEILARLDALAERLGVAAGDLWGILLQQAQLDGIMALGWVVFGLLVLPLAVWGMRYNRLAERDCKDGGCIHIESMVACGAVAVGFGIEILINANIAITRLVNPEFYALQKILEVL